MNIGKKSSVILGLKENEVSILKALSHSEMMISDLSTQTKIPRTSLYYILPKLEERGFVKEVKQAKKVFWRKMDDEDIYNTHEEALESFKDKKEDNETKVKVASVVFNLKHLLLVQWKETHLKNSLILITR